MEIKIVKNDNIEIYTESFGNPTNPAVILIMGASASMIWWDEKFCKKIAEKGFFVIRFDNRDTGCSSCYEPGNPKYDVMDMTQDIVNVLSAYNIERAHIIGMSLGGMLAQILSICHPEKVITLTLVSSSVWDDNPDLPSISERILQYHSSAGNIDWGNKNEIVKYMVGGWKLLNGSRHPFNEKQANQLAEIEINRARNLLSMFNHALLKGGESLYGKSKNIDKPTLIIHGTEDPVLPFVHALEIEKTIKNSKLVKLEGAGHEIHASDWELILCELEKHIK